MQRAILVFFILLLSCSFVYAEGVAPEVTTVLSGVLMFYLMANIAINGTIMLLFQKYLLKNPFKKISGKKIAIMLLGITFLGLVANILGPFAIPNPWIATAAITFAVIFAFDFAVLKKYGELRAKDDAILSVVLAILTNQCWMGLLSINFLLSMSESWGLFSVIAAVVVAFPYLLIKLAKEMPEEDEKVVFFFLKIWACVIVFGLLLLVLSFALGANNTTL